MKHKEGEVLNNENMNKLYFDIEILPAPDDLHKILKEIYQGKVEDGKKCPTTVEEFIEQTGFDGAFGRIACIGYAMNEEPAKTFSGDEKEMLINFWELANSVDIFIGFNIFDFDLRFIYQRSIILGVKPTKELSFARYRNFPIYDEMYEWSKWNMQSKISLDTLAKALGIPSSKGGEVEGKNVAGAYKEGKIDLICKYCEEDVEVTRKIYKKMIFSEESREDGF